MEGRDKRHNTVRELKANWKVEGRVKGGRELCGKIRGKDSRKGGGMTGEHHGRRAAMRTTCNQQCSGMSGLDFNGARRINPGIYTSGTKIEWKRERASFQLFKWIRIVQLDDINPLRWFERGRDLRMEETLMKMIHPRSFVLSMKDFRGYEKGLIINRYDTNNQIFN